jgi:ketosteroid isomerase-like protein
MVVGRLCAVFLILMAAIPAVSQVREKETAETREEKVRDLLERFNQAYQQKDIEGLAQFVSPGFTGFAGGRNFTSWQGFHDEILQTIFSRQMPPSTWEIEKIVTTPDMAWAYTKTAFKTRRQGQPIQADLYQVFVVQKLSAANASKSKSIEATSSDWKIVLIDYTLEREPQAQTMQPNTPQQESQPRP